MGVISVRFNENEEKILQKLANYYHEEKSKLLKISIVELYESIIDQEIIEQYEKKERKGEVSFYSAEKILSLVHDEKKNAPSSKKRPL